MLICNTLCMHFKSIVDKKMENTRVLKVGMGQAVLRIQVLYVADFITIYNLHLYGP